MASNASLVLHPTDPDWIPATQDIVINCLLEIELIADRINGMGHDIDPCYLAGDKFLDLIAFLGCSPSINFVPDNTSSKFSFIRLKIAPDAITALTSKHTHPPHCPACKKSAKDWRQRITSTELKCSSCGQSSPPWLYGWRKSAGFGQFFIEITEIFPQEAVPQQGLLDYLEDELGVGWQYFYYY